MVTSFLSFVSKYGILQLATRAKNIFKPVLNESYYRIDFENMNYNLVMTLQLDQIAVKSRKLPSVWNNLSAARQ